jgi:hypothetical protein
MFILGADILLQHKIPDLKLSWNNILVVIALQGFLILLKVG